MLNSFLLWAQKSSNEFTVITEESAVLQTLAVMNSLNENGAESCTGESSSCPSWEPFVSLK